MAKRNNIILILGIVMLLIGGFLLLYKGTTFSINCEVRVSNPLIGTADIDSATCAKTTKLFCGSPLSLASSDYNLKATAGSSFKQEFFTLTGAPGFNTKDIHITVCAKEEVNTIKLELFNKNDLKDTAEVSV